VDGDVVNTPTVEAERGVQPCGPPLNKVPELSPRSHFYTVTANRDMMATQDSAGIVIGATTHQQPFKLLELPSELCSMLESENPEK
jgi:hypothetical protein